MGGSSHDSLKVASALTVKVMEIQTSVAPSELWLRDDLENIYALLFRFFGYGFRLAMSNVGWHVTQKLVILLPDPSVCHHRGLCVVEPVYHQASLAPGSGLCTTARCDGISQHHARTVLQPLDRAYMRAFKSSIRSEVPKHFAEFFLEAESHFERANLDSSTSVLRQLLLSFVHTAAQNAESPQHRAAGWRFIDWNEVEKRELLAEAKRLLETGELLPRGTAEEPHAPDAGAEATDSEPEAHVLEPPADDHSSDSDDAHTGVEESSAPAVAAAPEKPPS